MLQDLMNMEGVAVRSKQQQSAINGGTGECRVFNNGLWSKPVDYSEVQQMYGTGATYSDGSSPTGYCCASCGNFGSSTAI
jgi:hypothetical protein